MRTRQAGKEPELCEGDGRAVIRRRDAGGDVDRGRVPVPSVLSSGAAVRRSGPLTTGAPGTGARSAILQRRRCGSARPRWAACSSAPTADARPYESLRRSFIRGGTREAARRFIRRRPLLVARLRVDELYTVCATQAEQATAFSHACGRAGHGRDASARKRPSSTLPRPGRSAAPPSRTTGTSAGPGKVPPGVLETPGGGHIGSSA